MSHWQRKGPAGVQGEPKAQQAPDVASLKELAADFRVIFNTVHDGITIAHPVSRKILLANAVFAAMTGYAPEELVGLDLAEICPRESRPEVVEEHGQSGSSTGTTVVNIPVKRKDGSVRFVDLTEIMVTLGGAHHVMSLYCDLTDRTLAEEARREQEKEVWRDRKRLELLLQLSTKKFVTYEEYLAEALQAAADLLESPHGYLAEFDEERANIRHFTCTPQVVAACRMTPTTSTFGLGKAGLWDQVVQELTHIIVNDFAAPHPTRLERPAGHIGIARFLSIPIISKGRAVAVVALANKAEDYTLRDIRQLTLIMERLWEIGNRKHAEAKLRLSQAEVLRLNRELEKRIRDRTKELTLLSLRLIDVQEAERRHLARELHDEIGQALTGIKLVLENLLADIPRPRRDEGAGVIATVGELLAMVRSLSLDLRPAILDDFGLVPALKWHFGRLAASAGLQVELRCEGAEESIDQLQQTALFRIAQEALTNVVRHAGTREVTVALTQVDGTATLKVADRGVGFVVESWNLVHDSTGLSSMKERTTLLGGHFSVSSEPGQGTCITATLPLRMQALLHDKELAMETDV